MEVISEFLCAGEGVGQPGAQDSARFKIGQASPSVVSQLKPPKKSLDGVPSCLHEIRSREFDVRAWRGAGDRDHSPWGPARPSGARLSGLLPGGCHLEYEKLNIKARYWGSGKLAETLAFLFSSFLRSSALVQINK